MSILLTLMWNMIASAGKREWIVHQNIRKSNILVTIYVYGMINWKRMLERGEKRLLNVKAHKT